MELEYDGTDFLGWQRQREGRTVQAVVEQALDRILGSAHSVVAAGRTDAGVHAEGMVASVRTGSALPATDLERALDAVLPPDVGVRTVRAVPPSFHARRDAQWKWYRYAILASSRRRPLLRRVTWHVRGHLDRDVLDAGAAALRGRHDFRVFASQGSPRRSTVRNLYAVCWSAEGGLLHLDLVGDGFLYRMVRAIAGTLVHWARGRGVAAGHRGEDPAQWVGPAMGRLLAPGEREMVGPVAPARALSLMAVGTSEGDTMRRLPLILHHDVESINRPSAGGPP